MWAITGMGQPSTMVRLMAFRDSRTLRYSILYLTIYNVADLHPPDLHLRRRAEHPARTWRTSDEVMPSLVITLANPYVAGLILAAPYGAVMSTVSGFLLIVASGLVRDLYQRFLRPTASERRSSGRATRRRSPSAWSSRRSRLNPPQVPAADRRLLQHGDGLGVPDARAARRLLAAGDGRRGDRGDGDRGGASRSALYAYGLVPRAAAGTTRGSGPRPQAFGAYYLLGFDPCVWGLLVVAGRGRGRQPG